MKLKFKAIDKTCGVELDVGTIDFLNGGIKAYGTGTNIGNNWVTEANGFKHECQVELYQFINDEWVKITE